MKRYNSLYYLLFVLLIMGAFASMAQNDYGIKILGFVSTAFCLLFLTQLLERIFQRRINGRSDIVELVSLVVLSSILAMRVFYIRFPFVEIVFGLAGLVLIGVYCYKLLKSWLSLKDSKILAILIAMFHCSIIAYVVSMITVPFLPAMSEPTGGIGFALLIGFVVMSFIKKEIMVAGEKVSGLTYVTRFKDRSVMLLTLFLLFTAYMGLTKIRVLPQMYSDEFPRAYFELVNIAEKGDEKPVDGKYKHEDFKKMYDRFVERNTGVDNK